MKRVAENKQTLTAKPVQHQDVKGKVLYYLIVENESGKTQYISIGGTTFKKMLSLQEQDLKTNGE